MICAAPCRTYVTLAAVLRLRAIPHCAIERALVLLMKRAHSVERWMRGRRLFLVRLAEDADGARRRLARVSTIALVAVRRVAPHRARLVADDRRRGPACAPRAGPFDFFALLATRF